MYSEEEKDMIFLVVDRKEVHAVQRKVQEIDPKAFFVVTDAYDTYGEGFQALPGSGCNSGTVIFRNTGETGTAIVDSRFSVLILPGGSGL